MSGRVEPPRLPPTTVVAGVNLRVTALSRALPVWCDLVGLRLLSRSADQAVLGLEDRALVCLHAGATGPVPAVAIGIFHVAIHVPARADLAAAVARIERAGLRHTLQDHLLSEAAYISDPDNIGIELAFDTPGRGRIERRPGGFDAYRNDGTRHSLVEPLDRDSLMADLRAGVAIAASLPDKAFVGHIHFRTAARDRMYAFYADVIGFDPHVNSAEFRFCDVGTRRRPHTVAFNHWGGEDVTRPPAGTAGVIDYTVAVPDPEAFEALRGRLAAAGVPVQAPSPDELTCADPEGNGLRFRRAA